MIVNNLRLIIFCVILVISQFLINNLTIFYVDLFAIVLVVFLISGNHQWPKLVVLSLAADLFGHWYLGSHLFAIVILSLFSAKFVNFYKMCNWVQRTIVADMFFLFLNVIIYIIDLLVNKNFTSFGSIIFEIVLLMPFIQFILDKFVNQKPSEFIFYD